METSLIIRGEVGHIQLVCKKRSSKGRKPAGKNLHSEVDYQTLLPSANLHDSKLNKYCNEILGFHKVDIKHNRVYKENLSLYVIRKGGPPLIGRNWLKELNIPTDHLFKMSTNSVSADQMKLLNF